MLFREAVNIYGNLRYVAQRLRIRSAAGRTLLYGTRMQTDPFQLHLRFELLKSVFAYFETPSGRIFLDKAAILLEQFREMRMVLDRLESGFTLDDIELYEIKHFVLLNGRVRDLAAEFGFEYIMLYDTDPVVGILDPDGKRIPHFSVYDSFDPALAEVRIAIRRVKSEEGPHREEELAQLRHQNDRLEENIRKKLSGELQGALQWLKAAYESLAELDLLLAKTQLALEMGLCCPQVADRVTEYTCLYEPRTAAEVERRGMQYQPVDIDFTDSPTLITGANMAGKTVLLEAVGLAQLMFQFLFFVPAKTARIVPVDNIHLITDGDAAPERGLSSFAREIVSINRIVEHVREGRKTLVLLDEPARTTNPEEGAAIVETLVGFFSRNGVRSLITTHLSLSAFDVRKLRVRGFRNDLPTEGIEPSTLQLYFDYSLTETREDRVPHEAIRIAEIFGTDRELVEEMKNRAEKRKQ